MSAEKGFAASIATCLSATGVNVWTAETWAAVFSAACSFGVFVVYWHYKRKHYNLAKMALERDEHERGVS